MDMIIICMFIFLDLPVKILLIYTTVYFLNNTTIPACKHAICYLMNYYVSTLRLISLKKTEN